ncbi:hypothetical protein PV04_09129 [Phialophora macrospora]|uniref:NAD-dependent epimerase/dehydratase domain-containing protein n=1 Tax=Phialophora macrospora TaxID=1851006 RepID=A0A0D2CG85_9EURO|nr:hypothetical protein PV04_09129 [Phialophora macrospora]
MALKLFITGATGYIGGDFLYLAYQKHPEWEFSCLVRNTLKGVKVAEAFPKVRLVYGDLDAVHVIEEEAARADVIYHFANADHVPSATAISKGLTRGERRGPAFWIHTSGAGILGVETVSLNKFGERLEKAYDDWENVDELLSLPDEASHRNVDKIVLATGSEKVRTAIVCPPTIYGPGRGPDNRRSIQIPRFVNAFLKTGRGFQVRKGENIWHFIHVQDLAKLYLLLGEAAAHGGPPATWNDKGYYLAEAGSFVWGDILRQLTELGHRKGLLASSEIQELDPDDVDKLVYQGKRLAGTNSRGTSLRAKKLLGWQPEMPSIEDALSDAVDVEARLLGLSSVRM